MRWVIRKGVRVLFKINSAPRKPLVRLCASFGDEVPVHLDTLTQVSYDRSVELIALGTEESHSIAKGTMAVRD